MLRARWNRESGVGVPVLTATAPQAERPAASFVSLFTVHDSLYTPRHDGVSAGGVGDWARGRGLLAARGSDGPQGAEEDRARGEFSAAGDGGPGSAGRLDSGGGGVGSASIFHRSGSLRSRAASADLQLGVDRLASGGLYGGVFVGEPGVLEDDGEELADGD